MIYLFTPYPAVKNLHKQSFHSSKRKQVIVLEPVVTGQVAVITVYEAVGTVEVDRSFKLIKVLCLESH